MSAPGVGLPLRLEDLFVRTVHPNFPRRVLIVALGAIAYSITGYSQSVLLVENGKKLAVVVAARGMRPMIEEKGKRVMVSGNRFGLHSVEEFYPVFISVRNQRAQTTGLSLNGSGNMINNQFEFRAEFESPYRLQNVFMVLELTFEDGQKNFFLHEIGDLEPRRRKLLELFVPTSFELGRGKYQIHIFTDGLETLHSEQPFAFRESKLDQMVAKRVVGRKDGAPEFFIGPSPEYPEKFLKPKLKGRVVLKVRIRATGAVIDPLVLEASDPAFGEAALTAVRQWRFIPAIKNGRPVEVVVNLPIEFAPTESGDSKASG